MKFASHVSKALALATALSFSASLPALADIAANEDVSGKTLFVKPGSWLRYSDALVSRVYTTTKVTLEIKGRGKCTTRLCPVSHNNVDLWALRSRLDLAKPEAIPIVTERTLRPGDEGTDVKLAQEALVKAGFSVKTDGKYGSDTRKAVETFQGKNAIDVDGEIGNATRLKLKI